MTSTTKILSRLVAASVRILSRASRATSTEVSAPIVVSTPLTSLSMVAGTPTVLTPVSGRQDVGAGQAAVPADDDEAIHPAGLDVPERPGLAFGREKRSERAVFRMVPPRSTMLETDRRSREANPRR